MPQMVCRLFRQPERPADRSFFMEQNYVAKLLAGAGFISPDQPFGTGGGVALTNSTSNFTSSIVQLSV